jgi:uncharacterized membrane protein
MGNIDLGLAFSEAWEVFSKNLATMIVGALLTAIIGSFSFGILAPAMAGGMYFIVKKAFAGQTPEIGDVFNGFSNFGNLFIGGLIAFALSLAGGLACCIGVFVTSGILLFLFPLIVDGNTAGEAFNKCWAAFKENWVGFVVLSLVVSIVMGAGSIALYVGSFFTMPFGMCITWAAYKQVFPDTVAGVAAASTSINP